MRKPRILWCGESSFLHTGYAIYGKEVLDRLFDTGKYEIAEFSVYGKESDFISQRPRWKYYSNMPTAEYEWDLYHSSPINQFGAWRFEDVCLDFKPDIVCDPRDWWMMQHERTSPFRKFYHWMVMPAIDSAPLQNEWLESFQNADTLFAYSEFGRDVIQEASCGQVSVKDVCSPSADTACFYPAPDKRAHKEAMGISGDSQIIGTVMRNQKRKLYPDLIQSFKEFCTRYPIISEDVFLYLHVSYPDIGWDIPNLINQSGVAHKILLTYYCNSCNTAFPSFLSNAINVCKSCGSRNAMMPNAQNAVPTEALGNIMKCFDLYVQYSICEGFGMPQVEAAHCSVPVMAMDYSAMSSVIKNIDATPIDVRLFREMETGTFRALPDNEDFIEKLKQFFTLPKTVRAVQGHKTYTKCIENYSWDKTAKKWEDAIDEVELKDHKDTWDSAHDIQEPMNIPDPSSLSPGQLVEMCIKNVVRKPDMLHTLEHLKMLRNLNDGFMTEVLTTATHRKKFDPYSVDDLIQECVGIRHRINEWEHKRVFGYEKPEFILRANQ